MRLPATLLSATALVAVLTATAFFRVPSAQAAQLPYSITRDGDPRPALGRFARVADSASAPAATISQKDKAFAPAEVSLRVGQTLEIVNDDATVHNAYCQSPDLKYNAGPQQPGASSKVAFTAAGTFEIRCAIHPKMKLVVKVVD